MKTKYKLMWCFVLLVFWALLWVDIAHSKEKPDVALWLARSCVGEANWDSAKTGECAAILHIYARRARKLDWTILRVVKRYSAAVKRRKSHPRPWVLNLNREATEPRGWPQRLIWKRSQLQWLDILDLADNFLLGLVPDPLPQADHYGGPLDVPKGRMYPLRTKFRNRFYTTKRRKVK